MCHRCKKPNEVGSTYCFSCGLPLDEKSPARSPAVAARPDASSEPQDHIGESPKTSLGQGVPAGFWIRFVAFLIDGIISYAVPEYVFAPLVLSVYPLDWDIIGLIVVASYETIGVSVWSTTIGKRILRLYVLRPDGSRVGPGRALARYFAVNLSILLLGIGCIMVGLRRDKRGLHDLICDTVVVKR